MKNFLFLLLVAIITLLALLFFTNPGLLDDIWLWLVGFAGYIVAAFKNGFKKIQDVFDKDETKAQLIKEKNNKDQPAPQELPAEKKLEETIKKVETVLKQPENIAKLPPFDGTTLTVLRYSDDGQTTLGLIFIRNEFFSYTLEDTFREEKIKNETRIPAGIYDVDFLKFETGLTKRYREKYSWFNYHLEIKKVENYSNVYIHIGNNSSHTAGCLLLADGVDASSVQKSIIHSRLAFKRFYVRMSDLLNTGEKIRINILDEAWFKKANLQNL